MSLLKGIMFLQAFVLLMRSLSSYSDVGEAGRSEMGAKSHSPPVRSHVAVEGVIYCKSCKFIGNNTLLGASPLPGATATLRCNNTKREITAEGKTDKNGYFFIQAPTSKITSFGVHKCKVFLGHSPLEYCKNPTDLNGGLTGGNLSFHKVLEGTTPTPIALYSVRPLAFAPPNATACPRSP